MYFTRTCSNPMELTNALALDYLDPALEGHKLLSHSPVLLDRYLMNLS